MEKFKPFELPNQPIQPNVAEGESISGPTTHAPTSGHRGRISAFVYVEMCLKRKA